MFALLINIDQWMSNQDCQSQLPYAQFESNTAYD